MEFPVVCVQERPHQATLASAQPTLSQGVVLLYIPSPSSIAQVSPNSSLKLQMGTILLELDCLGLNPGSAT